MLYEWIKIISFYCVDLQHINFFLANIVWYCLHIQNSVVCLQCRNKQTTSSLFDKRKKGIVYLCVIYPYGTIMLTQTKMRLCRTGRGMPNSLTYWKYLFTYLINEKRERTTCKSIKFAMKLLCNWANVRTYGSWCLWVNCVLEKLKTSILECCTIQIKK